MQRPERLHLRCAFLKALFFRCGGREYPRDKARRGIANEEQQGTKIPIPIFRPETRGLHSLRGESDEQQRILAAKHAMDLELRLVGQEIAEFFWLQSGLMNDLLTGGICAPEGIAVTG